MAIFRKTGLAIGLVALVITASACGDNGGNGDEQGADTPAAETEPTAVEIQGTDYAFVVPASIEAGTLDVTFTNSGQEPHFAGIGKVADGRTFEDVRAALSSPASSGPAPSGPPPFEDYAGVPVVDPGLTSRAVFELEPGEYALYCLLPSRDGQSHAQKGMVQPLTVTDGDGDGGELPETQSTVVGSDFAFDTTPQLTAGENRIQFRNEGDQLHEINLIKLGDGKTVDDVVSWFQEQNGPPPAQSLGGVAVRPGAEGVGYFDVEAGSTYAVICAIPDVKTDFTPHVAKGMRTEVITT